MTYRLLKFVGAAGFEPATPWSQTRYANRTALRPEYFFQLWCSTFYLKNVAVRPGFEPGVPLSEYDGLANRWFQPLTHPTFLLGFLKESANIHFLFNSKIFLELF